MSPYLTSGQRSALQTLVCACGLGTETIPYHLRRQLPSMVGQAEAVMTQVLREQH
jgi:hypothetical protein